ncbi:MAG: hypothetical protein DMG53_17120 [Acidobacteria bacterium]|nr:MAG: hypothetical protein DMG53_17120 [Acidobacteriota bacterium]
MRLRTDSLHRSGKQSEFPTLARCNHGSCWHGLVQASLWGWRLAVAIIATQVLGDLVNAFMGDLLRGSVGFVIAGALLVYLLRPQVRGAFASGNAPSVR